MAYKIHSGCTFYLFTHTFYLFTHDTFPGWHFVEQAAPLLLQEHLLLTHFPLQLHKDPPFPLAFVTNPECTFAAFVNDTAVSDEWSKSLRMSKFMFRMSIKSQWPNAALRMPHLLYTLYLSCVFSRTLQGMIFWDMFVLSTFGTLTPTVSPGR